MAASLAMASAHGASNLVANGDFGTGNFDGWTLFGPTYSEGVNATSSYHYAYFGHYGASRGIRQSLPTVAGMHYSFSFLLANMGSAGNAVNVSWNGNSVLNLMDAAAFGATPYVFEVTASAASTDIAFSFRNDPAAFHMTNVSVSALEPVPEPDSPALLLAGGGLVAALVRRRSVRPSPAA
ncbi:PEP-CTERM sorting domain-containing protein [Xylophilus rhododendri]|nr:PEP-CTERM sorting domain-containing protein [Xylophilus rhododendri]